MCHDICVYILQIISECNNNLNFVSLAKILAINHICVIQVIGVKPTDYQQKLQEPFNIPN